jgi:hypothetical protein
MLTSGILVRGLAVAFVVGSIRGSTHTIADKPTENEVNPFFKRVLWLMTFFNVAKKSNAY